MHSAHKWQLTAVAFLSAIVIAPGKAQLQQDLSAVALAENQITGLLSELADVHCTETVIQEKLAENGHVEASEREQFDYLIMMSGHEDDFQLSESRIQAPGLRHKLLSIPMLMSNGMATVLLVFHPYYRDGFEFQTGPEELDNGRPSIPIHFSHIPGRRTPAALALRGREYPLDLQGTAWFDKESKNVMKVDASLLHGMSDVGLRALSIHVEYKPTQLGSDAHVVLPALAVVDVSSLHQHWRNTHYFGNYRTFSADVEQDPNVKVRTDDAKPADPSSTRPSSATPKEKP